MLTISDTRRAQTCAGYSRRDFLQIGAWGCGALSRFGAGLGAAGLSALGAGFTHNAAAAAAESQLERLASGRSVVLLFLQGGPSHLEMFDPKMSAPSEIRSIFGETPTALPGVSFGAHFPKLAQRAGEIAVVRSYGSGNGGHSYQQVASGNNPTGATMGALYSRVVGTNHPRSAIPTNVVLVPEAIDPELKLGNNFETGALPTLTTPGRLGDAYAAFDPRGGGQLTENMKLRMPAERLGDRRLLLQGLDRWKRRAEVELAGMERCQQQAFEIIVGGVAKAFDLSAEDAGTIAKYDTSHLFRQETVSRWFDMRRSSNLLGRQMLLARRLCEAGCGFVTVSDCGWDHHSNNNSPKGLGGFAWLGPQVDHAVSAFLDDVRERGLSDRILLVVTGEMGRTPRINNNGGRDHYGELTPLLLAGGPIRGGQLIGQSDGHATRAASTPFRPQHLLATVMHSLLDIPQLRIEQGLPRDLVQALTANQPLPL